MTIATLTLVCLLALAGPLLSLLPKIHLPAGITQLLVGVIVGSSFLNWVDAKDPVFSFLGNNIGFSLVMFVAGSHVPLASPELRTGLKTGLLRALGIIALALPVAWLLALVLDLSNTLIYAVIIASSSAALLLPMLKGIPTDGKPIISMLVQVAVLDVLATLFLPFAIAPHQAPQKLGGALLVILAALLIYALLHWLEKQGDTEKLKKISRRNELALELRFALILLFSLVALGELGGLSPMLGGFCLGLVLASLKKSKRLSKQLFALTDGFFGPIFFIWLGANLDVKGIIANPKMLLLSAGIVILALLIRSLIALTGQPLSVSLITVSQLGIPAAAATLGSNAGVLQPGEDAAYMIGALLTIPIVLLANPYVVSIAQRTSEELPQKSHQELS